MSTITSPVRTSTTVPRTTSPSSMSPTLRESQYSIVSSGGDSSSCCPPAKPFACRSSLAISPYCLLYAYLYIPCFVGPVSVGSGGLGLELRDGPHHLVRRRAVRLLPLRPAPGLEVQRRPEADAHLARPREHGAARHGPAAPRDVHGYHRRPAQHREHARSRLGLAQDALGASGALWGHEPRAAFLEHPPRVLEGARVAALPSHRAGIHGADETPEEGDVEELGLGEERQLARRDDADQGRVQHADMVRHQEEGPLPGHLLRAARLHPPHDQRDHPQDRLQDLVEHRAPSTASSSRSTTTSSPR